MKELQKKIEEEQGTIADLQEYKDGLHDYTDGVDELFDGLDDMSDGVGDLDDALPGVPVLRPDLDEHQFTVHAVIRIQHLHITHIDNTLIHNGLDTNDVFLNKTEESLRTLHSLGADIQRFTHVGASADKLKKWNMDASCRAFYKLFRRAMRSNLCGDNPSMTLFKLYKLGYYCSLNA